MGPHRQGWIALAFAAACGGGGAKLDAGGDADADAAPLGMFGAAGAINELNTPDAVEEDPSLTADQLEIFFSSDRVGGAGLSDIWTSTRLSTTAPWSVPSNVVQLNTATSEVHPHVLADGLSMYLASDRPGTVGGLDIWFATRATRTAPWTAPVRVAELSSTANDNSAVPDADNLVLVLDSDRGGTTLRDLYISTRTSEAAPWRGPTGIAGVNTADNDEDGVFAGGGTALYFAAGPLGAKDLLVSTRASIAAPFPPGIPITELDTPLAELDPWISEDQRTLVFTSDRDGTKDLFQATR